MSWNTSDFCCVGCYGHLRDLDRYKEYRCWYWGLGCLCYQKSRTGLVKEKVHCCPGPCLLSWGYERDASHPGEESLTKMIQLTTPIGLVGYAKSEKETAFILAAPCGTISKVTPTGAAKESG
jgi:hypothetical protein